MPKKVVPLSDTQLKNAKPKDKDYRLSDGGGLYLLVTKDNNKWWRFDYVFNSKRKTISFGVYPDVTLAKARQLRDSARQKIVNDIDVSSERKETKEAITSEVKGQIHLVLQEFLHKIKDDISSTTYNNTLRRFEKDILPFFATYKPNSNQMLGDITSSRHISDIKHNEILKAVLIVESRGAITSAHRMISECNRLWLHALQHGYTQFNIIGNIDKRHALKKIPKRHYASTTDLSTLKQYFEFAQNYHRSFTGRYALMLLPYLFLRSGNIRTLEWSEIDFNKKLLTIKADKMKISNNGNFVLPLCDSAINILQEIKPFTQHSRYVFPNVNNKAMPMSDGTLSKALRENGFKDVITPHGFRATFSSLAYQNSHIHGLTHKAIEACLHHAENNNVAGAYNYQANYLEQMTILMSWWSNWLDSLKKSEG